MEKINIEALYKKDIEEKSFNEVYNSIINNFFDLINEIIEKRKFKFTKIIKNIEKIKISSKETLIEETLEEIKSRFEKNVASFEDVISLARGLKEWDDGRGISAFLLSREIVLENYVSFYNNIVSELDRYEEIEEILKISGYEDIKNEKEQKLILIFKEMMDYKKKQYSEEWNFEKWVKEIGESYNHYHKILEQVLEQIEKNILVREGDSYQEYHIQTNNIENILALEKLHSKLIDPIEGYKNIEEDTDEGMQYLEDLYNTISETDNEKSEEEKEEKGLWSNIKKSFEKEDFSKPISKEDAFSIASEDNNLKSDFCRAKKYSYTYISFDDADIDLIELKGKNYWQVQIKSGELSGTDYYKRDVIDWDGDIIEEDLPYLRCLIEVETGKYIYYPTKKRKKFIGKDMR